VRGTATPGRYLVLGSIRPNDATDVARRRSLLLVQHVEILQPGAGVEEDDVVALGKKSAGA
jgi:hypothetical protein